MESFRRMESHLHIDQHQQQYQVIIRQGPEPSEAPECSDHGKVDLLLRHVSDDDPSDQKTTEDKEKIHPVRISSSGCGSLEKRSDIMFFRMNTHHKKDRYGPQQIKSEYPLFHVQLDLHDRHDKPFMLYRIQTCFIAQSLFQKNHIDYFFQENIAVSCNAFFCLQ